ncbi:MAG TPA: VWA domain-containing protein, partial [Pirellulaceae bacterium]|nr:VWA domain-containing protein [Pirellulaceae bacterium]
MKPLDPRRLLLAAIFCTLAASSLSGVSEARGDAGGLDVVILVDVSRSMLVGDETHPVGNDPERLRWDAVKLVLDLLTEDDRLLVLPFNEECPAKSPPSTRRPVPRFSGEPELRKLDAARRQSMAKEIETFIHKGETPNTDDGGTGILGALGEVRPHLDEARRADGRGEQRPQVVLLLTDGRQDIGTDRLDDTEDDRRVHGVERKWRADDRIKYFAKNGVRVFTYGLGPAADMQFLTELAQRAGGSSFKVETNTQLVAEFRRLIWSLRDCWTKRMNLKAGDSSSESL